MCIECADTTLLALAALPLVGATFKKLHGSFHVKHNQKCHHNGCNDPHANHPTEQDYELLVPVPYTWQPISIDEVDAQFGSATTILLMFDRVLLGTIDKYPGAKMPFWPSPNTSTFPSPSEFEWFLGDSGDLHARWKTKLFVWNDISSSWRQGMYSRKEALEWAKGIDSGESFLAWQHNNEPQHQSELCEFFKDAASKFAPKDNTND